MTFYGFFDKFNKICLILDPVGVFWAILATLSPLYSANIAWNYHFSRESIRMEYYGKIG